MIDSRIYALNEQDLRKFKTSSIFHLYLPYPRTVSSTKSEAQEIDPLETMTVISFTQAEKIFLFLPRPFTLKRPGLFKQVRDTRSRNTVNKITFKYVKEIQKEEGDFFATSVVKRQDINFSR